MVRSARSSNSTQLLMLRKTSVLTADRANVIWQPFIIINTGESMCGVISIIQTGRGMLCCPVRAIWQWESSVLFMAIALAIGIFAERSYGWFFVLATFAALGGYKLFYGPYGRTGMVTVTLCSILSMVLYLFCEMVYLIAQYYELAIGEVLKQWPAVIQIAFSPDNLAESWFQLIFFLGGLAWFLIKRPLSKQKVVGTMDVMDDFNRAL